jgi:hypothetical protein
MANNDRVRRGLVFVGAALLAACSLLSLPETNGTGSAGSDAASTPDGSTPPAPPPPPGEGGSDAGADAGAYVAEVLADSPITYLRLEETTGPQLKDQKGAHDGTGKGAIDYGVPGVVGSALRFTGTSFNRIELGDAFDFAANTPFTIELWSSVEQCDQQYRRIFWKKNGNDGWAMSVHGTTNNGNPQCVLDFVAQNATAVQAIVSTAIPMNTWKHVVVTFDGQTLTLYIDGSPGGVMAKPTNMIDTDGGLTVGEIDTGYNPYRGPVDEIALYDKALTPARIVAHRAASGR